MEDIRAYQQQIFDGTTIENNTAIPDNAFALLTRIRAWRADRLEHGDAKQAAEEAIYNQDEFQALQDLDEHLGYLEQNWDTAADGRMLPMKEHELEAEVQHLGVDALESQHERLNGLVEGLLRERLRHSGGLERLRQILEGSQRPGARDEGAKEEEEGAGKQGVLEAGKEGAVNEAKKRTEAQEGAWEGEGKTEENAAEVAKAKARAKGDARRRREEQRVQYLTVLGPKIGVLERLRGVLRDKLRGFGQTPQEDMFEKAERERKERLNQVWALEEDENEDDEEFVDAFDGSEGESDESEHQSPAKKLSKGDAGDGDVAASSTGAQHGEEDDGGSDTPGIGRFEEGASSIAAGHFVHQHYEAPSTPRGTVLPAINHLTMRLLNAGASEPIETGMEDSSSDDDGIMTPDSDSDDMDLEAAPESTATQDNPPNNTPAEGDIESSSNATALERLRAVQRALQGVKLDDGEAGRDLDRADHW